LDTASFNRSLKFQKRTIEKLTENGFRFAIGSDRDSFLPELLYWFKYNIFSSENILTIATKTTPQLIFPKRKIGEIKDGYEGSFLVLNGNPLLNFENEKSISLKVKKGRIL
jgi:imidazolonepropionase-like amidohydrolase